MSNEHDKGTEIYSSGVGVYERPEDPIQNGGPSIGMDAELLAPIEFGCPREGWIEFQIERTDLQMVVNRYFVYICGGRYGYVVEKLTTKNLSRYAAICTSEDDAFRDARS